MSKALADMTQEELWALFPVRLCPYDPLWPEWYEEEKAQLYSLLGADIIERISHIGSASVPGLTAKPTVDILLEIKDSAPTDSLLATMLQNGYRVNHVPHKPPPHLLFLKGYTPEGFAGKVFHIHVRYQGNWDEIHFRDYLRGHPQAAAEYSQLKQILARLYPHDRDAYPDAKTEFVQRINHLAREQNL